MHHHHRCSQVLFLRVHNAVVNTLQLSMHFQWCDDGTLFIHILIVKNGWMAQHTGTIRRRCLCCTRRLAVLCQCIWTLFFKKMQKYDSIAATEHHACRAKIFAYVNCQIKQDCGREELVVRGFMVWYEKRHMLPWVFDV